jgi:predicted RNA polymerase sigma factor
LLAAATQWPEAGLPESPRAWLTEVASRRVVDQVRSDAARRRREEVVATQAPDDERTAQGPESAPADGDDTLRLLVLCCHPALTPASQVALTLRAVGGLTTIEIANAFLVPEATMAQRISRAKHRIEASGAQFRMPAEGERRERLRAVLQVLYLIFNEGYATSTGPQLQRAELAREAIRLTRAVQELLPDDGEVAGLLALMLLTDARRPARTGPDGELIPLVEQDRSAWDGAAIAEGVALVTRTLANGSIGPYQLQAAIAAVHDEAERAEDTDWPQILALYGLLEATTDNPMVRLNHAIATAMVHGPPLGLKLLDALDVDGQLAGHHRLASVRAHLLEMDGKGEAAIEHYRAAANLTASIPEQRYLTMRAARLAAEGGAAGG